MSEELLQTPPVPLGRYLYYRLGGSTLAQLKHARIISKSIPDDMKSKRPDGLITLGKGIVKVCIEYKQPAELSTPTKINKAVKQEISVAKHLCNLLLVTDSKKTLWINPHTGNPVKPGSHSLPVFDAKQLITGTVPSEQVLALEQAIDRADHSLTPDNDELTDPEVVNPSQLARTVWQKIWINTAKEPEKCLYNVVELFVFKFLSDLAVLKAHNNFASIYQLSKTAGKDEALKSYASLSRTAILELFPKGEDGTTVINGTIFVNEKGEPNLAQTGLFNEVLEDLASFDSEHGSFKYIQREFKTRLYESFLRQGAGLKLLGQYFTPRNVVQAIVKMSSANILTPSASLCDPFCGVGGFLLEAILESPTLMAQFQPHNGVITPQISILGYDKGSDEKEDERTIILAKANTLIYFSDLIARHNTPEFIREFSRKVINPMFRLLRTNLGTFAVKNPNCHDLILTNPPYVTRGSSSLKKALSDEGLSDDYPVSSRGTEALALQWILKSLKPGGEAFVIVPDGLLNQEKMLRHVKSLCIVLSVVSLPLRTFYSTPKKTYILGLRRKRHNEEEQPNSVFTYLVSEIGETRDAKRWELDENHLIDMVNLFNQFKGSPNAFVSTHRRCRTIPWETFRDYRHWMVDRYWDCDELQELGIVQEPEEVSIEEFNDLLHQLRKPPIASFEEEVQFAEVSLGDSTLFDLRIGTRVLKKQCIAQGIRCISSNVQNVFGYVEHSTLLTSFEVPSLTWGIDGNFDWYFIKPGIPFHPTDHCGVLRIKTPMIDPEYLYYTLRATKNRSGFDRTYRANLENMQQVSVAIPVGKGGTFDLQAQKRIAAKHQEIEKERSAAKQLLQEITCAQVSFD